MIVVIIAIFMKKIECFWDKTLCQWTFWRTRMFKTTLFHPVQCTLFIVQIPYLLWMEMLRGYVHLRQYLWNSYYNKYFDVLFRNFTYACNIFDHICHSFFSLPISSILLLTHFQHLHLYLCDKQFNKNLGEKMVYLNYR